MTIDKSKQLLFHYQRLFNSLNGDYKLSIVQAAELSHAIDTALDAVCKYQKIQKILKKSSYKRGGKSYSYLYDEGTRVKHRRWGVTTDNLCDSCTNIGCEFQSGIVRMKCAFYMPPAAEAIPKDQYEARLKADMIAMLEELKYDLYHALCHEIHGKEDCPCTNQSTSCLATFRVCDVNSAIYKVIQEKIDKMREG